MLAHRQHPLTLTAAIREAIDRDHRSPRRPARLALIDPGHLARFLRGERRLMSDAVDRLCEVLGLAVVHAPTDPPEPDPAAAEPDSAGISAGEDPGPLAGLRLMR